MIRRERQRLEDKQMNVKRVMAGVGTWSVGLAIPAFYHAMLFMLWLQLHPIAYSINLKPQIHFSHRLGCIGCISSR